MSGSVSSSQAGDVAGESSASVQGRQRAASVSTLTASEHDSHDATDAEATTTATTGSAAGGISSSHGDSPGDVSNLLNAVISLSGEGASPLGLEEAVHILNEASAGSNESSLEALEELFGSQDPTAIPSPTRSDAIAMLAQTYQASWKDGDSSSESSANPSELGSPSISPRIFPSNLPSPQSSPASPSSTHASSHASAKLRAISPGAEPFCINRLPLEIIGRIVDLLEPSDAADHRRGDVPGRTVSRSFNREPVKQRPRNRMLYELLRWRHWLKCLRFNRMWAKAVACSQVWVTFTVHLFGSKSLASFYQPSRETMLQRSERVLGNCCAASFFSPDRTCHGHRLKLTRTAYLGPVLLCGIHRHMPDETTVPSPLYACHVCLLQRGQDHEGNVIREIFPTSDKYFAFGEGNVCDACRSAILYEQMQRVPHSWWWAAPSQFHNRKLLDKVMDSSDAVFDYVSCGEGTISDTIDLISQELWLEYQTPLLAVREQTIAVAMKDWEDNCKSKEARRQIREANFDFGPSTAYSTDRIEDAIEDEEDNEDPWLSDPPSFRLNRAASERAADKAIRSWCWHLLKNGLWTAPETCVEYEDSNVPLTFKALPFETTSAQLGSAQCGRQAQSQLIILDRQGRIVPSQALVTPAFDMLTHVDKIWTDLFSSVLSFAISNLADYLRRCYGDHASDIVSKLNSDDVLLLLRHRPLWQRPLNGRGYSRVMGPTDIDDHVPMIPACPSDMPGKAFKIFDNVWSNARQELTACDCQICGRAKRKRQEEAKQERKKKNFRSASEATGILQKTKT